MVVHSDERAFPCDDCDSAFKTAHHLSQHTKAVHLQIRPHVCSQCDKRFSVKALLRAHMLTHSDEKHCICDECGVPFKSVIHLRKHKVQVHQRTRSHVCQICDKRFPTKSSLNRHSKLHLRSTDRPFPCDECDAMLASVASVKLHKSQVHDKIRPFGCEICDKRFPFAADLKKHQYIHGGERPFKCEICDKTFITSYDMSRHKRVIHEGVRLTCDICDKQLTATCHLNKHKQRIHNVN